MEVAIEGVKGANGSLIVGLFSTADDFLKKPVASIRHPANEGTVRVVLSGIPSGDYAISVLHDLNSNEKMDTNFVGIPKEGFGFSNDAMGFMGPPHFKRCMFHWAGRDSVVIRMHYF
ncbi:MAG: DUF2141 domain-containing protein [Bacteroidetes bacterium]|nr:DUF2141 domain-containing protein [Bacteroidota bacterium]